MERERERKKERKNNNKTKIMELEPMLVKEWRGCLLLPIIYIYICGVLAKKVLKRAP